jgi:hypothetical protein
MLIFFKPFRTIKDIYFNSWEESFNRFAPTQEAQRFMYLNNDFYDSKANRKEEKDEEKDYYDSIRNDDFDSCNYDFDEGEIQGDDNKDILEEIDELFDPPQIEISVELLPADNIHVQTIVNISPTAIQTQFPKFDNTPEEFNDTENEITPIPVSMNESISIFENAIENVQFTGNTIPELHLYPTLLDTSCFFELNKKQHQLFVKHALRLLQIWCRDSCIKDGETFIQKQPSTQLISHLVGFAGSGKSKVIESLLKFAKLVMEST